MVRRPVFFLRKAPEVSITRNDPFTCGECTNYDPESNKHCKSRGHFAGGPDSTIGLCEEFHQTELSIKERPQK